MHNKCKGGVKEGKTKLGDIKLSRDVAEECRAESLVPLLWVYQQYCYKLLSSSVYGAAVLQLTVPVRSQQTHCLGEVQLFLALRSAGLLPCKKTLHGLMGSVLSHILMGHTETSCCLLV